MKTGENRAKKFQLRDITPNYYLTRKILLSNKKTKKRKDKINKGDRLNIDWGYPGIYAIKVLFFPEYFFQLLPNSPKCQISILGVAKPHSVTFQNSNTLLRIVIIKNQGYIGTSSFPFF